jgi:hypothetical protein
VHGGIRTTFDTVPDRTSFAVMERLGVHRAVAFDDDFAVYRFCQWSLNQGTHRAKVKFTAHNNKAYEFNPALKAKCPKHKKGKKHKRHAR